VARLAFLAQGDHAALDAAIEACLARSERTLYARWRAISSARRAPVSSSSMMMAVSRRASKPLPAQAASSRRRPSLGTIGMGCSGMIGGFIRAIGLGSSSSSSSQRYRTRMTLYRVAAVLALRRRKMSARKSSRSAWVACSSRLPRPSRNTSTRRALSNGPGDAGRTLPSAAGGQPPRRPARRQHPPRRPATGAHLAAPRPRGAACPAGQHPAGDLGRRRHSACPLAGSGRRGRPGRRHSAAAVAGPGCRGPVGGVGAHPPPGRGGHHNRGAAQAGRR
jgi:hypothetical protein